MADQFDLASTYEELDRQSALNRLESTKLHSPESTGHCLYCGEELSDGRRWCNADCRDEWEKEQKRYG